MRLTPVGNRSALEAHSSPLAGKAVNSVRGRARRAQPVRRRTCRPNRARHGATPRAPPAHPPPAGRVNRLRIAEFDESVRPHDLESNAVQRPWLLSELAVASGGRVRVYAGSIKRFPFEYLSDLFERRGYPILGEADLSESLDVRDSSQPSSSTMMTLAKPRLPWNSSAAR